MKSYISIYLNMAVILFWIFLTSCSTTSDGKMVVAFNNSRMHSLNIEAKTYCNEALRYSKQKKTRDAIKAFTRSIEIDPSVAAYNGRSLEYYRAGRFDDAVTDANRAIMMNPKFPIPYVTRGNSFYRLKEYDRALKSYKKAIQLDPRNPELYYNLGLAYYKNEQYDDAMKSYDKAVELDPRYYAAWYNRACICSEKKDLEGAIEGLERAIAAGFNDADRVKGEAALANVRGLPEFKELLNKMGNRGNKPQ
ncbi:MAG: tetratricopeptide repeat protein [Spirochaetes bacterium]|nr:tetratricopeptide repeat protein [Spirochaetota bacterium]